MWRESTHLASKWHLTAMICGFAYATSAVDLSTAGFEVMRKEQDVDERTSSVSIEHHGRMIDEQKHKHGARSATVRSHNAAKPKLCDAHCTLNIKIASNRKVNSSDLDYKTMRLKSCKDETFHFDGCDQTASQAMICTNSERKPTGVRVLKNSRKEVVGYGSCCIEGLSDRVVETSLAFCGEPTSNLVSEGKAIATETKLHTNADRAQQNQSGVWDSLPANATSIEQGLALLPSKFQFVPMLLVGLAIGLYAIGLSIRVMYDHWQCGMRTTGSLRNVHSSSAAFIGLLWVVPVSTALGLLGVLMPEMAPAWQFAQALLVVSTLRKMPALFMKIGGGRLQLARSMQTNGDGEPVHMFSQMPFCCMRIFLPAKTPEPADVADLELGISLACCVLPVLGFLEMFFTLEAQMPANLTRPWIVAMAPGVATFIRMMEVVFIALCMASLRGLAAIVQSLNPKASKEMNLGAKSKYCQCFLGGLRLLPILYHLFQCYWNGEDTTHDSRRADAARSILICFASLACTWTGCKAFPADMHHYPEMKAASSLLKEAQAKMQLKPVLDTVQFCPFCGSGDLVLESGTTDSASCPHCNARQVPVNLIVHRDRTAAAVDIAASSAAGRWLDSSAGAVSSKSGVLNK